MCPELVVLYCVRNVWSSWPLQYDVLAFSLFRLYTCTLSVRSLHQVAAVLLATARYPHRRRRADHSIVFARWRQYSPPSNTWFPGVTDLYPKRLHLGRFSHFARHWCSQHTCTETQKHTTDNWFYWAHLQPPGAELLNKLWYRPGKNNKN